MSEWGVVGSVPDDVSNERQVIEDQCDREREASGLIGPSRDKVRSDCVAREAKDYCAKRRSALQAGRDPTREAEAEKNARRDARAAAESAEAAKKEAEWQKQMALAAPKARNKKLRSAARKLLLDVMVAPATTRFVSESYQGCPWGIEATLTADSQNRFGAYVRGTHCVRVSDSGQLYGYFGGTTGAIAEGSCDNRCR
jgi:hypothetical protein